MSVSDRRRIKRRNLSATVHGSTFLPAAIGDSTRENVLEADAHFRALPYARRLEIAHEIIVTRRDEIRLAWPEIVSLGVGFRRKRRRSKSVIIQELCIIVTLRRKWPRGSGSTHPRQLPAHFFIGIEQDGARVLCAVPTDIVSAAQLRRVRPSTARSQSRVRVTFDPPDVATGALAALVHDDALDVPYVISCKHVFSNADIVGGISDAPVTPDKAKAASFAKTSVYQGDISAAGISLDAQLARVSDIAVAKTAMASLSFYADPPLATSAADIPPRFFVHTPAVLGATPMEVEFVQFHFRDFSIPYPVQKGTMAVSHAVLVEYALPRNTVAGMSGSPVVSAPDGGCLLGMHIAGTGSSGLFIPAWLLADASSYGMTTGGALAFLGAAEQQ